jgi:CheY-like chemotaxis protein
MGPRGSEALRTCRRAGPAPGRLRHSVPHGRYDDGHVVFTYRCPGTPSRATSLFVQRICYLHEYFLPTPNVRDWGLVKHLWRCDMSNDFAPRVLLVDDELIMLETLGAIMNASGFVYRTASDGIDALKKLRETPPDIIISDLRMPNMSGFEFLAIVRRRFPQIAVIVVSGEFVANVHTTGLLTNAFFTKGEYTPDQLVLTIHDLYSQCPLRPPLPKQEHAPILISRSTKHLILTCTECLRSFPRERQNLTAEGLQNAECPSCGTTVVYTIDRTIL